MTTNQLIGLVLIISLLGMATVLTHIILYRRNRRDVGSTPVTKEGLAQFDNLSPGEAVYMAWSDGGNNPHYHSMMQDDIRAQMPVLGRALDRMVED